MFGAILPTAVTSPPSYLVGLPQTGQSIEAALRLAVDDFASDKNPSHGLPPQPGKSDTRPIVFAVCTDNHSNASVANATTHLAVDLGVPAIVGTAFSSDSRVIVQTLATLKKTDVLLMTPRSSDLVPADNAGHFVRLAPADAQQGNGLAGLFASREASIRAALGGDASAVDLKVALVYKEDAYGIAVATALKQSLKFNGTDVPGNGANFVEIKYGNPDAPNYPGTAFTGVTLSLKNAKPHAVIMIGTNELVSAVLGPLEGSWAEPTYRPRYFLSDGVAVKDLWDYLATSDTNDSTRKRILGTMPTGSTTRFNVFSNAYKSKYTTFNSITSGAAAAYDAAYMLAYSAVAIGTKPVSGPNLLDGFGLLQPGGGALQVAVGPDAISTTFASLSGGQQVNLDGASSTLDIDPGTKTVIGATMQVWCVPTASGHAQEAILSGASIDGSGNLVGSISASCGQ